MTHEQAVIVTVDTLVRLLALDAVRGLPWVLIAAGLVWWHARMSKKR